jgi:N-acetyl sugar amidotransferase
MKYCKNCLSTDLRPQARFDSGVCLPCQYSKKNLTAGYSTKLKILQNKFRISRQGKKNKGAYDCIVGVSGGKDSTRQAHWVRDRLGLRPLVVCCGYAPKQMSKIGSKNLSNLMSMGFDVIVATPAPQTSAQAALASFKNFGNVCKASEMSLFATVPRIAIDLGINTLFWGENTALQVGDSAVEGADEFDGNNMRKMNTLSLGGTDWLAQVVNAPYLLDHYIYPSETQFENGKINVFFLGPVWDDWSNEDNATYASLQGLTLRPDEEIKTGDLSNASMLDEEFTNINMMIKYYKFGFGRATDFVDEKIRNGQMSREKAIEIVKKYDGVCSDEIIADFSAYVGISVEEFWKITNKWVNKDLFQISKSNRPTPKFEVGVDYGG